MYNSRGHSLKLQFSSLNIIFVLANSVDPDEMPHYYAAFNLGILCLQLKLPIKYAIILLLTLVIM